MNQHPNQSLNESLQIIDDEIDELLRHHWSARHELPRVAEVFLKVKSDSGWLVSKTLMDIYGILDENDKALKKMRASLTATRRKYQFAHYISRILRWETPSPSFGLVSHLLNRISANLSMGIDDLRPLLLPLISDGNMDFLAFLSTINDVLKNIDDALVICQDIKDSLLNISGESQSRQMDRLTETEKRIYEALIDITPSAASAYLQAVADLSNEGRISYRGVANEFRETLRETMDCLAPDEEIMQQPGFRLEVNSTTPTMKQKARYILTRRKMAKNATRAPEAVVDLIEGKIAALTRATYDRASISSHGAAERQEVQQIKQYTNVVLIDLLGVQS